MERIELALHPFKQKNSSCHVSFISSVAAGFQELSERTRSLLLDLHLFTRCWPHIFAPLEMMLDSFRARPRLRSVTLVLPAPLKTSPFRTRLLEAADKLLDAGVDCVVRWVAPEFVPESPVRERYDLDGYEAEYVNEVF